MGSWLIARAHPELAFDEKSSMRSEPYCWKLRKEKESFRISWMVLSYEFGIFPWEMESFGKFRGGKRY